MGNFPRFIRLLVKLADPMNLFGDGPAPLSLAKAGRRLGNKSGASRIERFIVPLGTLEIACTILRRRATCRGRLHSP
jgi:hypothetical protein